MSKLKTKNRETLHALLVIIFCVFVIILLSSENPKAIMISKLAGSFISIRMIYLSYTSLVKNESLIYKIWNLFLIIFFTIVFVISLIYFLKMIRFILF